MPLSSISFSLFRFLLPPALISLLWLYLYPPLHGCAFPQVVAAQGACYQPGAQKPAVKAESAPFRLLVLADPQLEGDTSLPNPNAPNFPSLVRWTSFARDHGLQAAWAGVIPTITAACTEDVPRMFQGYRKRLDLLGNDYYLAHVYRSVKWWSQPTHMVVLGDLLGSQWIDDEEFEVRARRFWHRVFRGAQPVPVSITGVSNLVQHLDEDDWSNRLITVVGNHDIGYAGDINEHRIERFEKYFGNVNWDINLRLDNDSRGPNAKHNVFEGNSRPPRLRLIVLNSMNLDEPTAHSALREQTWHFLDSVLDSTDSKDGTVLLTHVPLHKAAGICVDEPMIRTFPADQGGGIREQNHLRPETSAHILDRLSPQAIVLNGHDHEGCDVLHTRSNTSSAGADSMYPQWLARRLLPNQRSRYTAGSIHEITVRSMMGSFGGNAGFLSVWFDDENAQWQFEYNSCMLGVQHFWWAVHVLAFIELGFLSTWLVASVAENRSSIPHKQKTKKD